MIDDDESQLMKRYGAALRAIRKQKALSQETLALASGLDRTYIGSVERGERNISLVNIHKIAKALNVPARDFFE